MNTFVKAKELQYHLEAVLREHPELLEDDELKLDLIEGEGFNEVLGQVVGKSIEAESMASAIKLRIDSLNERRSRFLSQHQFWRAVALRLMQSVELNKIQLTEATVSVTKGRLGVVLTGKLENMPNKFKRIKVEADKKALLDALKAGESIEGATLSNGPPTLTIRTK